VNYRHCFLERRLGGESSEMTYSFIPEHYARPDRILRLKGTNGVWVNGWRVIYASERLFTEEELRPMECRPGSMSRIQNKGVVT